MDGLRVGEFGSDIRSYGSTTTTRRDRFSRSVTPSPSAPAAPSLRKPVGSAFDDLGVLGPIFVIVLVTTVLFSIFAYYGG